MLTLKFRWAISRDDDLEHSIVLHFGTLSYLIFPAKQDHVFPTSLTYASPFFFSSLNTPPYASFIAVTTCYVYIPVQTL